jgi:hypothetical protein
MSDDKNLTENPDQVVDVPEVIDTDPINSNDPAEMLEVSGIESSVDESEPEAGINSFGAIAGKGLNEKISTSAPEELEEIDTEIEDSTEISDEEELEEESIEDLGEINQEIDEDLADDSDAEEEIVLNPFQRRKNRFKKGTLKWIKEENQIVSENIDFLEKEFGKLKNVLKVGIATYKSAKETNEEKEAHLEQFLSAQESLNEWISERQGTYAWQLLAALSSEQDKLAAFEADISKWVDTKTKDLYEEARDNKKKFLRKFRFSFGGLLFSLLLGFLVDLALQAMGLSWIPMVLSFIGITNPISIISQVIGFGAVFSWFFAFVFYFRDYSRWRKRLNREIADARFYLKAVSELSTEKGRLRFLHQEMHEYLGLMAKLLHNPWYISEDWIDYQGTRLDSTKLPKSMDVAVPREVGAFNDVKRSALEHFLSGNWRTDQIEILFEEYEKSNAMRSSSISSRIDEDSRLRRKLRTDIASDQYLKKVGDKLVENLTEYVQSTVLPEETGFSVDSIKPDELAGLKMKASIFDSSDDLVKWEDFISEVLGKVGSWQQINFSSSGQLDNLFDRRSITSYALIPDRLGGKIDEEIKQHIVDKDDKAGVEVIVRVDVSNWIDGDKIN